MGEWLDFSGVNLTAASILSQLLRYILIFLTRVAQKSI
jgi:hypothetical protein